MAESSAWKKVRVLLAKPGLDGHDLGIKLVARALRDQGMEVIYLGLTVSPEQIVAGALEEDVGIIGVSYFSGSHLLLTEKLMRELERRQAAEVKVVVGGIIPRDDAEQLKRLGVAEVFAAGSPMNEIAASFRRMAEELAKAR